MTAESFGSLKHWSVALNVIIVVLLVKFRTSGALSNTAILIGLMAGYALAYMLGMVSFGGVAKASMITSLQVMPYGFEFNLGAVILISIVSAAETVDDASATTKAGAGRTATDKKFPAQPMRMVWEQRLPGFLVTCQTPLLARILKLLA